MRRSLLISVCCILLVCFLLCSCGQKGGDTASAAPGVMTEVKDDGGNITGYERRYTNENGDITRWDVYDADQNYLYYVLYEYDDNRRLQTETKYKANGFAEDRYVYSYDDKGNLTEKAYELPHGEAEVTRYNKDGKEIERLYYGTDEKLSKREKLENGKWVAYDADGKKLK